MTAISTLVLVAWALAVAGWAWWHRWSAGHEPGAIAAALARLAAWRPDRRRRPRPSAASRAALLALFAESEPDRSPPGPEGTRG